MSKRPRKAMSKVTPLTPSAAVPAGTTSLGTVTAWHADGGLLVDYPGNRLGPLPALLTVPLDARQLARVVAEARPVLLTFVRGDAARPVVVGVVQAPVLPPDVGGVEDRGGGEAPAEAALSARMDGQEILLLKGEERVELRCGKASIVLTRSGKVLIQGTYLSSRSSGVHRIRGGSVEIN